MEMVQTLIKVAESEFLVVPRQLTSFWELMRSIKLFFFK